MGPLDGFLDSIFTRKGRFGKGETELKLFSKASWKKMSVD